MIMKLTTFFKYFFFILVLVACVTKAQEIDDEREFSYEEDSENGRPIGEKSTQNGGVQLWKNAVPIDMLNERVKMVSHLGLLDRTYWPSNATLINRGHDMMLRWPGGAGHIQINGTQYHLRQSHWHSPSEHTINGRRFDMEIHLVHQSNDNRTAVIVILYKIGRPDSFLSMMKRNLEEVADMRDVEKVVGFIDPELIKSGSRKYYRYIGSLTTPPCTENVIWTIVRKVRTVSREQVELIRDAVHDDSEANARPIQPINGRKVELYRPNDREN
ncbi:hypothetical protein DH2020_021190 [Rehmannia glutinosa]|uniref:Carbonic anhydrase n=1 Tax=Rehmannia glutinosa TaxID=99300 RepID=A0ABR0WDX7_REHGL